MNTVAYRLVNQAMTANFVRRCVAGVLTVAAATATAQSPSATDLNDEGKELLAAADYAGASAKFREAIAADPQPKYYFNLCLSLSQEGKVADARAACAQVRARGGDATLVEKAAAIEGSLNSPGATNANTPGGTAPSAVTTGPGSVQPGTLPPIVPKTAPEPYTFGFGADVLRVGELSGLRLRADYQFLPSFGAGVQVWADLVRSDSTEGIGIFGGAIYKHFGDRIAITPLAGAFSGSSVNATFGGIRAQLSVAYRFGSDRQHEVAAHAAVYSIINEVDVTETIGGGGVGYTFRIGGKAAQALRPF